MFYCILIVVYKRSPQTVDIINIYPIIQHLKKLNTIQLFFVLCDYIVITIVMWHTQNCSNGGNYMQCGPYEKRHVSKVEEPFGMSH